MTLRYAPRAISRFDRIVLLAIGLLALAVAVLIWRGDRVGVTVAELSPPHDATDVSTQSSITVQFAQEMDTSQTPEISVQPPISGTVRWQGNALIFAPYQPFASDATYTITVEPQIQARTGRRAVVPIVWRFRTGRPRVLYLAWDEDERQQLFLTTVDGGTRSQLTDPSQNVFDYHVAPDGERIAYSAVQSDGHTEIWIVDVDSGEDRRLLACEEVRCSGPVWAPDGQSIIYERRRIFGEGGVAPPRLWWLDPGTGDTMPTFSNEQALGHMPRFSADGRWLAYIVPLERQLRVVNLDTNQVVAIPNEVGEPPIWHPQLNALLFTDIQIRGEAFATHIFRADFPQETISNLSGNVDFNDGLPSWSSDGRQIAFGRKLPSTPTGRQIWVMNLDGSNPRSLTDAPYFHFSRPLWSPAGDALLVQRFDINEPTASPSIWLLDVATKEVQEIATSGFQASWLP